MSFNSAVFCAGAYGAVWNSTALGIFVGEQQSPVIEVFTKGQEIDNTDAYGRTTLGTVLQGADAFYTVTFMEWKSATIAALIAANAALGRVGVIGADLYDSAQSLVLTAQTGSLAATAGPATITASKAIVASNNNYRILLGPVLREVPLRMRLFPYISSSNAVHFTVT